MERPAALAGRRRVYFVDAAHFVYGAFLSIVWRFCRTFIKTPAGRQRLYVLGALNAVTRQETGRPDHRPGSDPFTPDWIGLA